MLKFLGACIALGIAALAPCAAAEAPPIFVGGQFIRQAAILDQRGHLLVPVRGVFEAFGASVEYTPPRIVVVRKNGVVIAGLVVGRRSGIVANRVHSLGAAPVRRGGRIYVPLRSIAEIAGASVRYSTNPRLVDIRVPHNVLAVGMPLHDVGAAEPDAAIPPWSYALVGFVVVAFMAECVRRIAGVAHRRPRIRTVSGILPSVGDALQLPYAPGARHQNGIGKIGK